MSYPNFPGKHAHEPVFTPAEGVADAIARGCSSVPAGIVLSYQRRVIEYVERLGAERVDGYPGPWRTLWRLERAGRAPVGILGNFGVGAPGAVMTLEEAIALGARRVVSLGTAGGLQPSVEIGATVVCDRAVRDEGVSHHYLPSARFAHPNPDLTAALAGVLQDRGIGHHTGPTWTIDAPFRETAQEARHYRDEGVLTVDMEASALFAVGELRRIEVASAFVVSDHVFPDEVWRRDFQGAAVHDGTIALLEAALAVLQRPSTCTG